MELTAHEKADLAYKQRVYDLAVERKKALDAVVDDGYTLPTNYGKSIRTFTRQPIALATVAAVSHLLHTMLMVRQCRMSHIQC